MAAATFNIKQELKKLELLVKALPPELPEGLCDGPIATFFGDREVPAKDKDEGPYRTVNKAYERVFQIKNAAELSKLVTRRRYSIPLLLDYFQFWAAYHGMDCGLLALRVSQVNDVISKTLKFRTTLTSNSQASQKPSSTAGPARNATLDTFLSSSQPLNAAKERQKADSVKSSSSIAPVQPTKRTRQDRDYVPPKESDGSDSGSESEGHGSDGSIPEALDMDEVARIRKKAKSAGAVADKSTKKKTAEKEQPEDGVATLTAKPGRAPKKAQWAISQYTPLPMQNKKSEPIWKWTCRWCPLFRTSPRSKNIKDYVKETLELKINSNFISHFDTCAGLPKNKNFEAFVEAEEQEKHSVAPSKQSAFSGTTDVDDGEEGTMVRSQLVLSKNKLETTYPLPVDNANGTACLRNWIKRANELDRQQRKALVTSGYKSNGTAKQDNKPSFGNYAKDNRNYGGNTAKNDTKPAPEPKDPYAMDIDRNKCSQGELTCFHCQRKGHYARDCPDLDKPKVPLAQGVRARALYADMNKEERQAFRKDLGF
ncbi:hypothetical protein D9619_002289 [Psilocybe cf. subviscida]|uniref:CCHC-type domain-containing protein n=1 Tax=Psilocybe cf. subviscida TaxID=2480587 RepID=A0A8H5BED0_9AGAR|nr:hypothetical protein D9619_002289 [Psilocybe cf. subviscida]